MTSIIRSSLRLFLTIGLVALFVQGAFAHTYLSSVVLGGTALTEGDCVRPHPSTAFDSPISLVTSADMTCGFLPYAAQAANRKCPIAAGSRIGIQWHHNNNGPSDDILDPSHKGPVMFYLSKTDDGSGSSWFKIYQDGYTASNQQWATDKLIAARGLVTVTIPSDIAPGNYLLRGEILALHNGYDLNGVQPYVGCVELTISGSGSSKPSGVAFPGAYKATDPGLYFNLYTSFSSYPIPGPALYLSGSGSSSSGSSTSSGTATVPPTRPPATTTGTPTATPTATPTVTPTRPPSSTTGSSSGNGISVQMNSGSNVWWFGVRVTGGSQTTAKVEITDSGSVSSWTQLVDMSYAYVFDRSVQLKLPISVRITSTSGKQVTLTNVFTSWSFGLVNTGQDFTSSPSNTVAPVTPMPRPSSTTSASGSTSSSTSGSSTSSSSSGSSSGRVTVSVFPSANTWWFACTVSGTASVASVDFKDSTMSSWAPMRQNQWGYTLETNGREFKAPVTIRVTNAAGQAVTATLASITPGLVASAN